MSIQAVTSQTLQVRTRARAPIPQPKVQPVAPIADNSNVVTDKLDKLLQEYARANALKNKGNREETAAKKKLNTALVEEGLDAHIATVDVEGNQLKFVAAIATSEAEEIDAEKLFELVGKDMDKFMAMVSVTKTAVEATLGSNAVIMVTKKVTKPASLSVTKVA
jgi:hypothetical protein